MVHGAAVLQVNSRFRRLSRIGLGAADQYVYSLQNFLPAIAVARQVSTETFGFFSSVMLVYSLILGASRASVGETLAVRTQDDRTLDQVLQTLRHLVWRVIAVVVLPAAVLLAWILLGRQTSQAWVWIIVMLLALPFHLLHDAGRAVLISKFKTTTVLLADLFWLGAAGCAIVLASHHDAVLLVTLLWACGGIVACLAVLPPRIVRPGASSPLWDRGYSLPSFYEYAMQPAVVQGSQLLVGLVGRPTAVAALRGGATLFRPLQLALSAHRAMTIGGGQRRSGSTRSVLVGGLILSVVGTLIFGLILWLLPSGAGRALLGQTWSVVRSVMLPLTLAQVAGQMTYALVTHLKARALLGSIGLIRLVGVFTIPVGTVGGALCGGLQGAAWGFCAGQWVGASWTFLRTQRVPEA